MMISLADLAQNAVHFGHKVSRWNPKMKNYIYGQKDGIHIIDLKKTASHLEVALKKLKYHVDKGDVILFVSTKPQTKLLFEELGNETGYPIVVNKWIGGMLTNFATIQSRIKYLKSLRDMVRTGEIDKFSKKEKSRLIREKSKLEIAFSGIIDMYRKPDVIFVTDGKRDVSALREAKLLGIPIIGIADTNVDPDLYTDLIPANDDAISSLTYILSFIFDVVKTGKKREKREKGDEKKQSQNQDIEQSEQTE
ncbi:30S ribosomal protein S2 [Candidatus Peregrinibacteria bacterium]|nr:30S ribosomal protein S2 [Candidatus Peregrinibacteria bacterium]